MMADRVMRGSRLGSVSYETDRNHDLAPRQIARYLTENGGEFEVPFADDRRQRGSGHPAEVDLGAFVLLGSGVLRSALTA